MTDWRDQHTKAQEEHDAHLLWLSWPIIPAVLRLPYYGVYGRVLGFDGDAPFVQTGAGLLRLDEYESPVPLRVGSQL